MDLDYIKHYCDEVKELICVYNDDLCNRTDIIESNFTKEINHLNKKITVKINNSNK